MRYLRELQMSPVEQLRPHSEDTAPRVFLQSSIALDQEMPDLELAVNHTARSPPHQVLPVSPGLPAYVAEDTSSTPSQAERARMQYQTDNPEEIPRSPSSFPPPPSHHRRWYEHLAAILPVAMPGAPATMQAHDPQHAAFRQLAAQPINEGIALPHWTSIRARLETAGLYYRGFRPVGNDADANGVPDDRAFLSNIQARLETPHSPSVRLHRRPHNDYGDSWVTYMAHVRGVPPLLAHFDWRRDAVRHAWLTGSRSIASTQNRIVVYRSSCVPIIGRANMQAMVWFEIERALALAFVDETMADNLWESWCQCEAAYDMAEFDDLEDDGSESEFV
nr:hypothetical protein CFP56_32407 [Quercus suber]